jgi:hypothetical protein
MKSLFICLFAAIALVSCVKENIVTTAPGLGLQARKAPITFKYSGLECEQWRATFTDENNGKAYTVTSDTVLTELNNSHSFTVKFEILAPRCSSGALILSDELSTEVNLWVNQYPEAAVVTGVTLQNKYYIVTLGE